VQRNGNIQYCKKFSVIMY